MPQPSDWHAFRYLFREFFAQLFISEASASDHQFRVAMISVIAFVVAPGFFIPLRLAETFEIASRYFPILVSPLTRLMATIFVTFALVAVGLIAAFEWDALAFDRRDAMILGTLPVSGRTIVAAKVAALGALLCLAASGITLLIAVPFSFIATSHQPMVATARLFVAHLVTTISASAFVFCSLVTVRGASTVFGRGRVVIGSVCQFVLISSLLCFIVFVPTSLQLEFLRVPRKPVQVIGVHMQPIPGWSPTNWFVGLYDVIRGDAQAGSHHLALIALTITVASAAAATMTVMIGYRLQLRLALAPSSASGTIPLAGVLRVLARVLAGRRRAAQGLADFIVVTLARSRAQQAPLAMNAALGVVMIVLELTRRGSDFAGLVQPSMALSRVPLLLAFWLAVGLRASFFVPSELPAAWTFRTNATQGSRASHGAIRGAAATLLVPPVGVLTFVLSVGVSAWHDALRHGVFVALAVLVLVECVALTVPFVPYTRPYEPGHAKLKTHWPLYGLGVYLFAYVLLRIEKACWSDSTSYAVLLLCLAAMAATLDLIGERLAGRRPAESPQELVGDEGRIAVLDIGAVVHRAHAES